MHASIHQNVCTKHPKHKLNSTHLLKKINIKHKILYAFYDPISEKLKIKKEQEEELTCEGEGIHRTK
jgi:hypothetical protein